MMQKLEPGTVGPKPTKIAHVEKRQSKHQVTNNVVVPSLCDVCDCNTFASYNFRPIIMEKLFLDEKLNLSWLQI